MITVFSGEEERLAARAAFVGDDTGPEEVERTGLPVCAQQGEHWQKRPAARRAEK
jgi:hypothetical protein